MPPCGSVEQEWEKARGIHLSAPRFARAPADESSRKGHALAANFRRVEHGLLSVGLKIHCLDNGEKFDKLIEGLGGASKILDVNHYKDARASLCLVLPPVGSANSATQLIEYIEQFIGSPIFGNRQIQLQLCSPGQLSARASALLGSGFIWARIHCVAIHRLTSEQRFNPASTTREESDLFYTMQGAILTTISLGGTVRASATRSFRSKMVELIF